MISDDPEDLRFGHEIASNNQYDFVGTSIAPKIMSAISTSTQPIVFWNPGSAGNIADRLPKMLANAVSPGRVFLITDQPLNAYPHLPDTQIFSHHLFRRFKPPGPKLYSKLVATVAESKPFGLERFFPAESKIQKITITRSTQKIAAVEALQNFFNKLQLPSRLSALVAQASDELIMNALFDAPMLPNGTPYRRKTERHMDFSLIEKEHVEICVTSCDEYVGIAVADQFGTLKKDVLLKFLRKDYEAEAYTVKDTDPGAGLGLRGTMMAGLSILFVSAPNMRTEVMIFFPKAQNYKEFREGFRFLSIQTT